MNIIRLAFSFLPLLAGCGFQSAAAQEAGPELCVDVTGEARDSDEKAVEQIWQKNNCNSTLNLKSASSLLKGARVDRLKRLGLENYDPQSPRGTDDRYGSELGDTTRICVPLPVMVRICPEMAGTIAPQLQKRIVPCLIPQEEINDIPVQEVASEQIQQVARLRKELGNEIKQSASLKTDLRQTGDSGMMSQARKLENSMAAAQAALDNSEATLHELNEQIAQLTRTRRSANAALTRFRRVW